MKYLLWMMIAVSAMTILSVYAEAGEVAARIAPKTVGRVPASADAGSDESANESMVLPHELEGASIEVGFSLDEDPEPHMLAIAVANAKQVNLFQLDEQPYDVDHKVASQPTTPVDGARARPLSVHVFSKRIHQAVDGEHFFEAAQPARKKGCRDQYVLRIKLGDHFRERRGCTNQSSDPFAEFAQLFFRDASIAWNRSLIQ